MNNKVNLSPQKSLYYIALIPPEPVYSQIHELKQEVNEKYGSRQALKSPPHITLISPFRTEVSQEKIREVMAGYHPDPVLRFSLKDFDHFKGKVLFIAVEKNESAAELQSGLEAEVREREEIFHYNYDPRPWHPHITLGFRDWDQKQFRSALSDFEDREFRATFEVGKLSLLKHNGKTWDVVG